MTTTRNKIMTKKRVEGVVTTAIYDWEQADAQAVHDNGERIAKDAENGKREGYVGLATDCLKSALKDVTATYGNDNAAIVNAVARLPGDVTVADIRQAWGGLGRSVESGINDAYFMHNALLQVKRAAVQDVDIVAAIRREAMDRTDKAFYESLAAKPAADGGDGE